MDSFLSEDLSMITSSSVARISSQSNRKSYRRSSLAAAESPLDPSKAKRKYPMRVGDLSLTLNESELCLSPTIGSFVSVQDHNLYQQFHLIYQTLGNTQQVFEAVRSFTETCSALIDQGLNYHDGPDLSWLVNERNTWRLVNALYTDRSRPSERPELPSHSLSEKEVVDWLYMEDRGVREAQLVIDWLERNARDEWSDSGPLYTDRTVCWENTLHQLLNEHIAIPSSRTIVRSVDPDAPRREKLPLHDMDEEDNKRLLRQVYIEIRKGRVDKAKEMCQHCGQPWRAAVLDGWRLFHDPNIGKTLKNETVKDPIEGNPMRRIWKLCAWRMCEHPETPVNERIIMGALCGHLHSLLLVCTSWEDMLWAYTKVMVDVSVENRIQDYQSSDSVSLPPEYWNQKKSFSSILKEVSGIDEGTQPHRIIQKCVISGATSELFKHSSDWVQAVNCDSQFLRFLAHLILVLRLVDPSCPERYSVDVLRAYIKVLAKEGDLEAIAFYCSLLPEQDQIEEFSAYMETITDSPERRNCVEVTKKYDLKLSQMAERVVRSVRNQGMSVAEMNLVEVDLDLLQEVTEDDAKKISSLDWLMFSPGQRVEAIWEANALIRYFLAFNKVSAAKLTFQKIPPGSTELILQMYGCKVDETNAVQIEGMPAKANAALFEYLCYRAYLDGMDGFSFWFHEFYNSKPSPPHKPLDSKDFSATVAYEHRMERYKDDLERWTNTMLHQTEHLYDQLLNIVLFPNGWLVDTNLDEEPRKSHLERLRGLCIPKVFFLLQKVLHSMEQYEKVMDLNTLLMDETTQYYKIFNRQQLTTFARKMAESCEALLQKTGNPFGEPDVEDIETDQDELLHKTPEEVAKFFRAYEVHSDLS